MQIYANKSNFKLNFLNATSDLSFKMKTVFETQEFLLSTNYNEQFILKANYLEFCVHVQFYAN